jgi:hypothetical protein
MGQGADACQLSTNFSINAAGTKKDNKINDERPFFKISKNFK